MAADRVQKDHILVSQYPPVSLPREGLYSYVHKQLVKFDSLLALIETSSEKEVTYSEVLSLVERVAFHLNRHGVKRADVFALCAPNSLAYIILILALARLGAVFALVNALSSADEINNSLSLCEANFFFVGQQHSRVIKRSAYGTAVKEVFIEESKLAMALFDPIPLGETAPAAVEVSPKDVCGILFSSGTTGFPKAVELSQTSFLAQGLLSKYLEFGSGYGKATVVYQPLSHLFGTILTILSIVSGGYMVLMPRFNFEQYLELIAKHQVEVMHLVPPVLVLLTKSPVVDKFDLKCVKDIVVGAAPVSAEIENSVKKRLGSQLYIRQGYGMTEGGSVGTTTPVRSLQAQPPPAGTAGTLFPNTKLKVIDLSTGEAVGPHETGEVLFQAEHIMLGYKGNPEATREVIDPDGWMHTGDVGYYNDDGYLFIVDRIKELIKYNAYQVAPAELEGLLLTHPDVADVGVIGVPDESAGEVPQAWVVRKPGSSVTEEEIFEFVADKAASFKKLRGGVKFVGEIPKSGSGKILRRIMKQQAKQTASKV